MVRLVKRSSPTIIDYLTWYFPIPHAADLVRVVEFAEKAAELYGVVVTSGEAQGAENLCGGVDFSPRRNRASWAPGMDVRGRTADPAEHVAENQLVSAERATNQ